MEYSQLSLRAENILYMLKFLNYAYNQPDSEHDLPLSNEEKTGGQQIFFHIMDELQKLEHDIKKILGQKKEVL